MIYVNSAVNPIIYYCRIFSKTAKDYKTSSSGAKVSSGGRGGGQSSHIGYGPWGRSINLL